MSGKMKNLLKGKRVQEGCCHAQSFCTWVNDELLPNATLEPGAPRKISVEVAAWIQGEEDHQRRRA